MEICLYARKSSANSTLYKIGQPSFHGQCVICIRKQCFVLQEKGDTWKVMAPDFCVSNTLINIVPVNKNYLVSLFDVVIFLAETTYTCS